MPTKVIRMVDGAKEEMVACLKKSIEWLEKQDDDLVNWGCYVVLVDDMDRPWMIEDANMTPSLIISTSYLLSLKEGAGMLMEETEE